MFDRIKRIGQLLADENAASSAHRSGGELYDELCGDIITPNHPITALSMPRIPHEQGQFYKAKILSLVSIDHQIIGRELQLKLEQEGVHLDRNYIGKFLKEVYVERIHGDDRRKNVCRALETIDDQIKAGLRHLVR